MKRPTNIVEVSWPYYYLKTGPGYRRYLNPVFSFTQYFGHCQRGLQSINATKYYTSNDVIGRYMFYDCDFSYLVIIVPSRNLKVHSL